MTTCAIQIMSQCILIWLETTIGAKFFLEEGRFIPEGKKKERITVHSENCKSGRKLKPVIIFRGAPPPKNGTMRKNTIAY